MMMRRLFLVWSVAGSLVLGLCGTIPAQGAIHLTDSFLVGGYPAVGEYALGNLVGQGPTLSTATGTWGNGLTTTTPGIFNVVGSGLSWPTLAGTADGAVQFVGDGATANTQSAVRSFDNLNMVAGGIYYLSGMMSFDENFAVDSTSSAFTGVLNLEEGTPDAPYTVGVQWGFQANAGGGVDAIIRVRDYYEDPEGNKIYPVLPFVVQENVQPGNHLFVMRMASDQAAPTSGDFIDVWVDPSIQYNQFQAGVPQLPYESISNWLAPTSPERVVDTVVLNATNLGTGAIVKYDEIRFADTWEEATNGKAPFTGISDEAGFFIENISPANDYDHEGTYLRDGSATIRGDQPGMIIGSLSSSSSVAGRGILSYSLDDIPEGTTVIGAMLTLSVKRLDESGGEVPQIDLYLADLPAEFDEDLCLWAEVAPGVPWTSGPGNPTGTLLGSVTDLSGPPSKAVYGSSAEFVAAVQAAIDGDTPLDLALIAPFESSGLRQFIEFWSDDAEDPYLRPVLELTFAPVPEPTAAMLLLCVSVAAVAIRRRGA